METPPVVLAAGDIIRTMNRAELSMLNDVIRDRYTQLNREAKRALDIGCTVQFTGKTGKVIRGKVEKINPNSESSPFSRVNIMDVANTLSPFGPRGPPLRALFGVLSLCLAPLARVVQSLEAWRCRSGRCWRSSRSGAFCSQGRAVCRLSQLITNNHSTTRIHLHRPLT